MPDNCSRTIRIPRSFLVADTLEKYITAKKTVIDLKDIVNQEIEQSTFIDTSSSVEENWALYCLLYDIAINNWKARVLSISNGVVEIYLIKPTETLSKEEIRNIAYPRKREKIENDIRWIRRNESDILPFFANPKDIVPNKINPVLEVCATPNQWNIYRYCRYLSSVPYSTHVGRRICFLIRDASIANRPIIGIAAIGSSVYQMRSRDKWIGWSEKEFAEIKKERISSIVDLYTCVSIPPYNLLLAGKLISSMILSNEVRHVYENKYKCKGISENENKIALVETTNYYGLNSSQYNRLTFDGRKLFQPIGTTQGYGSSFISDRTFKAFLAFLSQRGKDINSSLATGSNWRLRILRKYYRYMKLDEDYFLNSPICRGIYIAPLATNTQAFLMGEETKLDYFENPLSEIINYWKYRWLSMRVQNLEVMEKVKSFNPDILRLSDNIEQNKGIR